MLSEVHNANFITFWLNEWTRLGAETPNEFVCDMSLALLNAGVRAFAKLSSVQEYIGSLFSLVNAREDGTISSEKIPNCFIRIDIAHLIKNVISCKALQGKQKKVKEFFTRSVAALVKMDSLITARCHILAVLVVAYTKTEGM